MKKLFLILCTVALFVGCDKKVEEKLCSCTLKYCPTLLTIHLNYNLPVDKDSNFQLEVLGTDTVYTNFFNAKKNSVYQKQEVQATQLLNQKVDTINVRLIHIQDLDTVFKRISVNNYSTDICNRCTGPCDDQYYITASAELFID